MGVTSEKGKFRARVNIGNGKRKSLGYFDTKLKAQRAISKYRKQTELSEQLQDARVEEKLEALTRHKEDVFIFDPQYPVEVQKPSLWDRIKSLWQNTKQQS